MGEAYDNISNAAAGYFFRASDEPFFDGEVFGAYTPDVSALEALKENDFRVWLKVVGELMREGHTVDIDEINFDFSDQDSLPTVAQIMERMLIFERFQNVDDLPE